MAVKFGVRFILNFSLSSILGKNAFVIAPFDVSVHSLCHHLTLCSFCSLTTTLFGIFMYTPRCSCFLLLLSPVDPPFRFLDVLHAPLSI